MANLQITVVRHYLDWPLHQTINQPDLIQQLGAHATGRHGEDLTDKLVVNLTQANVDQPGEYPVMLSVMDATGQTTQESVTLHVRPASPTTSQPTTTSTPQQNGDQRRAWLWVILAVIIVLLVWWGVSAHHRADQQAQSANNAQQSSQISDNSSSISKLSSDNQRLANQVAELKGAAKQYQRDHDQQALNNRLDQVQTNAEQLQNQTDNSTTKNNANQVTNVINQVRQDPENGVSTVNNLKGQPGFNKIWDTVSQQLSTWLDRFSSN